MHIIKPCPECKKQIRFPIDKGKIKVKCVCGNSFIADPDNPGLYANAHFDLSRRKSKKPRSTRTGSLLSLSSIRNLKVRIINSILNAKYAFQNFALLSASQQRKIIFITIVAIVLILVVLAGIILIMAHKPAIVPKNGIIL